MAQLVLMQQRSTMWLKNMADWTKNHVLIKGSGGMHADFFNFADHAKLFSKWSSMSHIWWNRWYASLQSLISKVLSVRCFKARLPTSKQMTAINLDLIWVLRHLWWVFSHRVKCEKVSGGISVLELVRWCPDCDEFTPDDQCNSMNW